MRASVLLEIGELGVRIRRSLVATGGALLLLAGCASERVLLLPSPDGQASKLLIRHGDEQKQQTELNAPYQAASVSGSSASVRTLDEAQVRRQYSGVLDAMPSAAKSYVLYFETDSIDAITPDSQAQLDAALRDVAARVQPEVTIIGHTDRVGDSAYNDKLSRDRAVVIAAQLRTQLNSRGLDDSNVDVAGRGEREPLVPTDDEVANAKNRRVEINVR